MPRNEKTSKRVAAIAGRIMANAKKHHATRCLRCCLLDGVPVDDIIALAASALTQSPDRKKAGRARSHK